MSAAQHTPRPRFLVVAGADPKDKGIHDTQWGHYGVTFATVSFADEYSHMPEYGAKMATEYADRIVDALNSRPDAQLLDRIMARIDAFAASHHVDAMTGITASTTADHRAAIRAAIAKATGQEGGVA